MKIAIYSDFFNGILPYGGGGEVYGLEIANCLARNHKVTIFTNKTKDKQVDYRQFMKHYGANVSNPNIEIKYAPSIGYDRKCRASREFFVYLFFLIRIWKYSLFINSSDSTLNGFANSIFKIPSIKIIHFPWNPSFVPKDIFSKYCYRILKRHKDQLNESYSSVLCNSTFTAGWTHKIWNIDKCNVLYPPINYSAISFAQINNKENIILFVGRVIEEKRCLELAKAFKNINSLFPSWKFIIAGNINLCDRWYHDYVKNELQGTNYEMLFDVPKEQLVVIYKKAKIFWSAKGFGTKNPSKMEHFGMTTVEAMANGCVPVVINRAGQAEIVNDECGEVWDSFEELEERTISLIKDEAKLKKLAENAIIESEKYLMPNFEKSINKYIDEIVR